MTSLAAHSFHLFDLWLDLSGNEVRHQKEDKFNLPAPASHNMSVFFPGSMMVSFPLIG